MNFSKLRLESNKKSDNKSENYSVVLLFEHNPEIISSRFLRAYHLTWAFVSNLLRKGFLFFLLGFLFFAIFVTPFLPQKKFKYPNVSHLKFAALASDPAAIKEHLRADSKKSYVGALKQKPYGICYIHGFLSNRTEIEPVISKFANKLNANLFFTRLQGHGYKENNPALKTVKAQNWIKDATECFEVAQRVGKKSIIVASGMGATLATLVALNTPYKPHALIFTSPNYGFKDKKTVLLKGFLGGFLAKMGLIGQYKKPQTREISQASTTKKDKVVHLPKKALKQVTLLSGAIKNQDFSKISSPVLVLYSQEEEILDPFLIEKHFSQIESHKAAITGEVYRSHFLTKQVSHSHVSSSMSTPFLQFYHNKPYKLIKTHLSF